MKPFLALSRTDQTTDHLRAKLLAGHWGGKLPGVIRLCTELNVSQATMRAAILRLEAEGVLTPGGHGRSRSVVAAPAPGSRRRALRVGVLLHERMVDENPGMQATLAQLQHAVEQAGHVYFLSRPCQASLRHETGRIARYLAEMRADAWVVVAPRRELLEWFAAQPFPAIALGGASDVKMAAVGTLTHPARAEAVRRLLDLGHERIVMICLERLRRPEPGIAVRNFTAAVAAHGRRWNYSYNVPEWEETPAGFRRLLEGLFSATPPTALLLDETPRATATLSFLAARGLRVPEQVSLFVGQWDSSLAWCDPPLAHVRWEPLPVIRHVVRWLAAVAKGDADREHVTFPAEFVPGGSLGPVWKG